MSIQRVVKIGDVAREELIKGANFLADAVKSTLGPFGANCVMEKGNRVTNDGVSIAREIFLEDEIQNRGVAILKEAASKTNDIVGDGTTTAITLTQAILKEASNNLSSGRAFVGKKTPSELIQIIEKERKEIDEKLLSMATPVDSEEKLIASARVSVEDEELSRLIGKTQWELGKDGVILVEETAESHSSIELIKGIQIDNGFTTSLMMNNQEKQTLEVSDTRVLLTNYTISDLKPLEDLGKDLAKMGVRSLVIVARAFSSDAIRDCFENIKNGFNIWPINAPFVHQDEVMKDLEAVLGGRYIHNETSTLDSVQISDLGFAKKIIGRRYSAILTGKEDERANERVTKRLKELNDSLKGEPSEFMKKSLQARIAQMTHGFAMLKVGATSETERKYKKDKAEDAVNATRIAFQDGVVEGAGLAFVKIAEELPDSYILKKPLNVIYQQIKSSAPADFVVPDWAKDPVRVLRVALQQACSVASVFASATIAIATKNPKSRYVEEVDKTEDEENVV